MMEVLASRGPDSTGVAIYRDDGPPGMVKYSLRAPVEDYDWAAFIAALELADEGTGPVELRLRGRDAVAVTALPADRALPLLREIDPAVGVFGFGHAIEVYKDIGSAAEVCARYGVAGMA